MSSFAERWARAHALRAQREVVQRDEVGKYLVSTIKIPADLMPSHDEDPASDSKHISDEAREVFETGVFINKEVIDDSLFMFHTEAKDAAVALHAQMVRLMKSELGGAI